MNKLDYSKNVLNRQWKTIGNDVQYDLDIHNKILYFQCSVSHEDWKINFDFPAIPYKKTNYVWMIHRGFLKDWKSIQDILSLLYEAIPDLTIVGYSHGSVLACLAHEDYLYRTGKQPTTYVFGCPRFLWNWNYKQIEPRFSNVHNIQNIGDIVTHVPFKWMGYRDVGQIEKIGSNYWLSGHTPEQYIGGLYV